MAGLKLGKLPDRKTVKITFTASAELNKLLITYASAYEAEYGLRESITDLIPHMLEAFIMTDCGFQKSSRTTAFGKTVDTESNRVNDENYSKVAAGIILDERRQCGQTTVHSM